MHNPFKVKIKIICDIETHDWAISIRTFLELLLFQCDLCYFQWKSHIDDYINCSENYDFTILCLHGMHQKNDRYHLISVIDTDIQDAEKNRIRYEFRNKEYVIKNKSGILISIGCGIGGKEFAEVVKKMGYSNFIGNKTELLTFGQVILWIQLFFEFITRPNFISHSTIELLNLNQNNIVDATNYSNYICETKKKHFALFSF
ncbi:MAG: hypothetical protein PF637_08060 [Spirochaetes bacterium]|jgi:hypothetical protein|nr:hypothetical protein [Spirochaetota bacterium]